ncbi:MAG: hypothetical protein FP820_01380 [Sulfurimonas sp.]|nr:hypothetical protein [Sulfurimonas sp.]MBU1217537.1 hypothetical protein [bacterium]MBU1433803.1 hypothetical protein [bacterium]MBU1503878.1 hypothetical protein [bacterium]MBU3939085.1 hypothetical protein [bacterium]
MNNNTKFRNIFKRALFLVFILSSILHAQSASAEKSFLTPNYSFKNISMNYLDWSQHTEEKTSKRDFSYLEFEGGAGWNWGEFYIYFDIENPLGKYEESTASAQRLAFKPVLDVNLYENLALHIHDFNFHSTDYYVHNLITGLSYKIQTDFGLWVRPFVGSHYQESSYYSGYNGVMTGWTFLYAFNVMEQKFSLAQWHEMTFGRNEKDGYDNKNGIQGALSFWWHPNAVITTGLQYRYAENELGSQEYQDGFIYSLKYNF